MFKPHHLELFYYVARHGGISAASRHIPYGIGQPAISGQMADFERNLGTRLFERRPFQLTEPGRQLYASLAPFYDGLGLLWQQLRQGPEEVVRIAADGMLGPEFLATLLAATPPRQANVCYELGSLPPTGLETWLHERRVHLAITTSDRRIPGVRSLSLPRAGLRLLVRRKVRIDSPGHFWRQKRIAETLISPVEASAVHRTFARGLRALRVEWAPGIHVDSTALMMELVAGGHGVGVGLDLPSQPKHPEVRALPLTGFERVPVVALWRPRARPVLESVLAAVRHTAAGWLTGEPTRKNEGRKRRRAGG